MHHVWSTHTYIVHATFYGDRCGLLPPSAVTYKKKKFCFFAHQILEEGRDLSGEHSQVEEACGDFIVVLGQVTISQVLQDLNVLLLVFHMCLKNNTYRHRE